MAIPRTLMAHNRFERPENKKPKRVVFLSVEGNVTEPDYFRYVKEYQKQLGIKAVVDIRVLQRAGTDSAILDVLNLLENYIEIRNDASFDTKIKELEIKNYDSEFITRYIEDKDSIPLKDQHKFEAILWKEQLDLEYLCFLNKYHGENDVFGVVVDRDEQSHTADQFETLFCRCDEKRYKCFLTNPRFEFWLLLHVSDVKKEYAADELEKMLDGKNKSVDAHLHDKTGMGKKKTIQRKVFEQHFLHNIDTAIQRASEFCTSRNDLLTQLGTNLGELFVLLRE